MLRRFFIPTIIAGTLLTGNVMADTHKIPVTFVIGNFSDHTARISKDNPIEVDGHPTLQYETLKIPPHQQLVCKTSIHASHFKPGVNIDADIYYTKQQHDESPSRNTYHSAKITDGTQTVLFVIKKDPITEKIFGIKTKTKRPRFDIEMSNSPYSASGGKRVNPYCYQTSISAQ